MLTAATYQYLLAFPPRLTTTTQTPVQIIIVDLQPSSNIGISDLSGWLGDNGGVKDGGEDGLTGDIFSVEVSLKMAIAHDK